MLVTPGAYLPELKDLHLGSLAVQFSFAFLFNSGLGGWRGSLEAESTGCS